MRDRLIAEKVELASFCGIHHTHVGHMIAGRRSPSVELARKMATYFSVSVDELLTALGI